MNHNLSHMYLTGWLNHDCTTWNYSFSFTGDTPSEAIDRGKCTIRYHFFPNGNDGDVRSCHDAYHDTTSMMGEKT